MIIWEVELPSVFVGDTDFSFWKGLKNSSTKGFHGKNCNFFFTLIFLVKSPLVIFSPFILSEGGGGGGGGGAIGGGAALVVTGGAIVVTGAGGGGGEGGKCSTGTRALKLLSGLGGGGGSSS